MQKSIIPPAWAASVRHPQGRRSAGPPRWRSVRTYDAEIALAAAFRSPGGVAAALFTRVRAPLGGRAELRVHCDGDVEVHLAGHPVPASEEAGFVAASLDLEAGANDLLLTVGQRRPALTVSAELLAAESLGFSCVCPPDTSRPDRISGVFLFWRDQLAQDAIGQWRERFGFLRGLGMDALIVQFSVVEGKAFYPSRQFSTAAPAGSDPTLCLLEAAAESGFSVHLGVASDERNWWDIPFRPADLPGYVEQESERNNLIATELITLYRDSPALEGIYLSHEIHLGDEWGEANMPHLVEIFNRMADGVRRLAPELVVSTAPFFSLQGTVEQYEDRWRRLLEQTRLDVLMLQDGVGCDRHITVDNMVPYYEAMARACDATGVALWTDLELFDLNPPHTVSPERISAQLSREAKYVQKVVAYSLSNLTPEFAAALPRVSLHGARQT